MKIGRQVANLSYILQEETMSIGRFYGGVAALLYFPPTRQYLLLKRSPAKDYGAGTWECVTGRVDQGEGFEDALRREV
ncbi:MAG TPA: NUDIX domain-containing protein, partial [Anaerolineae bacterium]